MCRDPCIEAHQQTCYNSINESDDGARRAVHVLMDKKEAKRLGAWISLLGGACFVVGALAAIYVAFIMKPDLATRLLVRLGHLVHHI